MKPSVLRTWLMRQPRPAYVIADDKRIEVAKIPRPWPELLETVLALKPAAIACHAASGDLIRARSCEWSEDGAAESESADAPKGKTDIQVFAGLIAEAYDKGSKSYSPLLDSAMQFIERQGQMLAIKDREIVTLRTHNTKLQAELLAATSPIATEEEPSAMGLLAAGIQAYTAAQTAPEVPAANGKAKRS